MKKHPTPIHLSELSEVPLVSVLTPCYNAEKYIRLTMDCVQAQTFENWEMIICDDGSTDASIEIIETYAAKDSRIQLIQQANGGAAAATNTAYAACRGDIIAFLDADDLFARSKLELCVRAFLNQKDSGYLTHRLEGIDAEGKKNGIIYPGVPHLVSGWCAPDIFDNTPTRGLAAPSSGNLVRREVLKKLMPIPCECQRTQDAHVIGAAMLLTPVIGLNQVLGSYRIHSGGQSRGVMYSEAYHLRQLLDRRTAWNALGQFCQSQGFDEHAEFLKHDVYEQSVGYLEHVIIYHALTGKLPEQMQANELETLYNRAGRKGRRLKPLLKLPLCCRRCLLCIYRLAARMTAPIRMKIRSKKFAAGMN